MTTDGLTPNELPGVADYESAMPPAGPMKTPCACRRVWRHPQLLLQPHSY